MTDDEKQATERAAERIRAFRFDKGDHVEMEHEAGGGAAFRMTERGERLMAHRMRVYGKRACSALAIEHMNHILRLIDGVEEAMLEAVVKHAAPHIIDPFDILFAMNTATGLSSARTIEGILKAGIAPACVEAHSAAAMRSGQLFAVALNAPNDGKPGDFGELPPGVTVLVEKREGETTKRDIEQVLAAMHQGRPRYEA